MAGVTLKRNYYSDPESAEIAMPDSSSNAPINKLAPEPWNNEFRAPEQLGVAQVPDEVPQEVINEMSKNTQDVEQGNEEPEETDHQPDRSGNRRQNDISQNMRELREARQKAERERDEYMLMLQMQMKNSQPVPEPERDDFDMDPDALVEGKNLKKYVKEIRDFKKQFDQYQQQSTQAIIEAKIKAQYPDFDRVVSTANVQMLNEIDPEIAETLRETPNLYNKAVAAYKIIKNMGIYKDETMERDEMRAKKNFNKPKPLTSISPQQGDSPLSKANAFANGEFTPEMREKLRKEMLQARRSL